MSEIPRQLLEHLKAGVFRDIVVIILDMSINVLLELGDLQVMVTLVVRIHLDPVVPVELPDAHSDMSLPMTKRSVDLWLGSIEVEVRQRLW